jgi:hypothetical protein
LFTLTKARLVKSSESKRSIYHLSIFLRFGKSYSLDKAETPDPRSKIAWSVYLSIEVNILWIQASPSLGGIIALSIFSLIK